MDDSRSQQTSLYNGVSNRSHGWKTRKPPVVVKWNGASRSSSVWDSLKRDPDLWFRDGDCYVYLHGRGQSRRGPSFKVPYSALLEAKCQPLIDKFMPKAHLISSQTNICDYSEVEYHPKGLARAQIELFIPAPIEPDKRHSFNYHLATRNLFAFIFRRSMVGESLGSTLITLMHSLQQFRTSDADNIQDLMSYMDEEGYLELNGQPTYASAMVLLGEEFQLRDLYIDAFAHCCGMGDQLHLASEYQFIPWATRELIQRTRFEMNARLRKASDKLKTFLDDEMPRADIAVYPGAHQHLELFRTFLRDFYAVRFGYYPPQTAIFDADALHAMRHDFEALYKYLRDERSGIPETTQVSNKSGISLLQSIESFDQRCNHEALAYPLPLVPEISGRKSFPWWNGPTKTGRSRRANDLTATWKATNSHHSNALGNHLVSAYRRFEDDQVFSPTKACELGGLSLVDGRNVRWFLIYVTYQTLRQATKVAEEVRDVTGAQYHLCMSTVGLPPWEVRPVNSSTQHQLDHDSLPATPLSLPNLHAKLDNGDSARANQAWWNTKMRYGKAIFKGNFSDSMSQKSSALWRSLSSLTKPETGRLHSRTRRALYYETAVSGQHNEVNSETRVRKMVCVKPSAILAYRLRRDLDEVPDTPGRYSPSEARTSDTSETYVTRSSPESPTRTWESERASICTSCGLHDIKYSTSRPRPSKSSRVNDCGDLLIRRAILQGESPPIPPRRRPLSVCDDPRMPAPPSPPSPQQIVYTVKEKPAEGLNIQMPSPKAPTPWDYIQGLMEVQARDHESRVEAEWKNQFTSKARPGTPLPATTETSRRASAMF
ncbi:hypothetical protein F4859DRAFT_65726 [Xylaria cf. heliscus]|nr:hypothetical protein F4859DRAFT_65726 [Xylaria cf. heliscus]